VQLVITVFDGGDKQIGQSKSSPSSTNEANFFNNSGFLDTSATRATDFSMSKNKDISSDSTRITIEIDTIVLR
jgi:hypothetical protein